MAGNSSLLRIFCLYYPADKSAFSCLSVLGMGIAGSSPCANPPSRCAATSSPPRTTRTVLGLSSLCLVVILPNKFNWRYSPQEGDFFPPSFSIVSPLPNFPEELLAAGPGGLLAAAQRRGLDCRHRNPSTLRACSLLPSGTWPRSAACALPHAGGTGGTGGTGARVTQVASVVALPG